MRRSPACYLEATKLEPSYASAHLNLGTILTKQKKRDEAVASFRKAAELMPRTDYVAYNSLGAALAAHGELTAAIDCFKKAIEGNPKHAAALSNLGRALAEQGELDEAIAWCRKAIEADSNYARAYEILGGILYGQNRLDEAIACHRKAIELEPSHANAHYNLGNALRKQKKLEEAIASYRRTIKLKPDYAAYHMWLGAALLDQEQLEEATSCYRRATELDPKNAEAFRHLGDLLRKSGDISAAIDAYSACIQLSPDGSGPHNNYGLALLEVGRTAEAAVALKTAVKFFDRLAKANPGKGAYRLNLQISLVNLARCQLALNDKQAHEDACQSLVALFPPAAERKAAHWGQLGQLLYRAGGYREARDSLEKAISLRRETGPHGTGPQGQGGLRWWYLALAQAQLGEKAKSLEIYQELVQQSPNKEKLPPSVEKLRLEAAKLLGLEIRD